MEMICHVPCGACHRNCRHCCAVRFRPYVRRAPRKVAGDARGGLRNVLPDLTGDFRDTHFTATSQGVLEVRARHRSGHVRSGGRTLPPRRSSGSGVATRGDRAADRNRGIGRDRFHEKVPGPETDGLRAGRLSAGRAAG